MSLTTLSTRRAFLRTNPSSSIKRLSSTISSPPRNRSLFKVAATAAAVGLTAYTIGSIYPPSALRILFPVAAPAPPADAHSPESIAYVQALEAKLQALPALQRLRSQEDTDEWYETRPYEQYPPERAVNNLTAGALRGPGKLALPPLARVRNDEKESAVFLHLGRGLCGHDGIVHGGLLATLLDETLARNAIRNLPEPVGVTAKLTLNYRAPTHADQFIVIKTKLEELKGRRAVITGRIEDMDGNLLVEANGIFVQPRYAKLLNTGLLRKAMGEPPLSAKEGPALNQHEIPILLADGEKLSARK